MKRSLPLAVAVAFLSILAANGTSASETRAIKLNKADLVPARLINDTGYKFTIGDSGATFVLRSVKSPGGQKCMVHVPSVAQELRAGRQEIGVSSVKVTVHLDFWVTSEGVPVCSGGGDQCELEVEVPDD